MTPAPAQLLEKLWYAREPGAAATLLAPLAAAFGGVAALRRAAYARGWRRSERIAVPVVVVGNVTVGGTGKTPLTIWLARQLASEGARVGVLTRGYGARLRAPLVVHADADPAQCGDEAVLLARELEAEPACEGAARVVASPDRVAGAHMLQEWGAQIVICDDGLQHYRLRRDLELAVVDERRGLGNGRLLPAGPLREPPQRLAEVDFVVLNVCAALAAPTTGDAARAGRPDLAGASARLASVLREVPLLRMRLEQGALRALRRSHALASSADVPPRVPQPGDHAIVHAVAGIGDPERFFLALEARGFSIRRHAFADHHAFRAQDLDFGDGLPVLMTSKDAVKCRAFADERCWEVPVEACLEHADAQRLLDRARRLQTVARSTGPT